MTDPESLAAELAAMKTRGAEVDELLRPIFEEIGCAYALVIWTRGGPGFARYASNEERGAMIGALRELVIRLEQGDALEEGDGDG